MSVLIVAILIGLIPAKIAQGKGRSFGAWWFYGTLLFIVALPHSLLMKSNDRGVEQLRLSEGMKKCQHCAEFIKSDANVCRYCGRDLATHLPSI